MGVRHLAAVAAVGAIALGLSPAAASDTPHITDPCGSVTASREVVRPEHDICTVWLSTLSDPSAGEEPVRIEARFRTAGGVDDRPPSGYYLGWQAGGCVHIVTAEDPTEPLVEGGRSVLVDCPDTARRRIQVTSEAITVAAKGRDVVLTVTFADELDVLAGDHGHGDVLGAPWAAAGQLVGPYPIGFYGWEEHVGTFSVSYDRTVDGDPYRIGR